MNQRKEVAYYPFLDGFRAIAISGVLLTHAGLLTLPDSPLTVLLYPIFKIGHLGVDMFFVISGFLITGVLIEDWNEEIRVKRFYIRRFFKIVPQYLSLLVAGFLLINVFRQQCTTQIVMPYQAITHIFFLQNYTGMIPMFAHTWSICIEEHFYWFYPLLIYLVFLKEKNDRRRRFIMIGIAVFLIGSTMIFRQMILREIFFPSFFFVPDLFQTTLFRMDALWFGCLLKFLEPYYAKDQTSHWRFLSAMCFILGLSIYVYFASMGFLNHWDPYLMSFLAPGFLFLAAYKGFVPLRMFTEHKSAQWIGRNSYGIYLWHYPILPLFKSLNSSCNSYLVFFLYISVAILLGAFTTVTIEKYSLAFRKKIAP